jgi:hypothetical protein
MSALPLKADIGLDMAHVCFVPTGDIEKTVSSRPVQDFTAQAALPHPANPFGAVPRDTHKNCRCRKWDGSAVLLRPG